MVWFKVDDNLAFHPKAMRAGNAALGLWVRGGSWSAFQLTDGLVPIEIATQIGTGNQIDRLVSAGLWMPEGSDFRFHEWAERQPTRDAVETKRRANADRIKKWREQHRDE